MIKKIGVLGAGQMGGGIAQVSAMSGFSVTLFDAVEGQVDRALAFMRKNLTRQVEKGALEAGKVDEILGRIEAGKDMNSYASCDLVCEAIVENEAAKLEAFRKLDSIVKPEAILASNTSSISITMLAAATKRPDKVIGMHFFNPVPVMKLVEVTRAHKTSEETFALIAQAVLALGKEMAASQDYPGFIVNRILVPMLNEAAYAVYENLASPEDIDKAMKLGTNQPMGPLTLSDFIGLDTILAIMEVLYRGFGDPKYRPCPLLVKMVRAGYLGKKSGRGFFIYS